MLVVHVSVHVLPQHCEVFRRATLVNATSSRREPGVARFDLLQQQDDPTRFVLVEAYRTPADATAHKETSHYAIWRDTVAPMMAEPRSSVRFDSLSPE